MLDLVDEVLVMTVNPGFGGQRYLESTEPKIAEIRRMITESGRPIDLEVDGGIDAETAPRATAAGANVLVAGSAIFAHPQGPPQAIPTLRTAAASAFRRV